MKTKAWTDLNSTSLKAAAYLEALLELEFTSGAIYRYFGVPAETYGALLRAQSKGTYFNQHIRNRFAYAKIRPEEPTRMETVQIISDTAVGARQGIGRQLDLCREGRWSGPNGP